MALDGFKNLAISAVATAPSPPTSGTSLTVTASHGARFPTPPFNLTIWPPGALPDPTNAEIARCTAVAGDVLTIARVAEGPGGARTIVVGDFVAATFTAKWITDLSNADNISAGTLNTARLPTIATLTSPTGTPAGQVRLQDLAAAAGTQVWRIGNITSATPPVLQFATMPDDMSSASAVFTLDRNGNARVTADLYEKGRTTPIGHWIDVAWASGNFTSDSGTFAVDAGDMTVNGYTLIGKTLIWNVLLNTITITGSPSQLRIAIPGGFTVRGGFQSGSAVVLDGSGLQQVCTVANISGTVVAVSRLNGSFTAVSNAGNVAFDVAIPIL